MHGCPLSEELSSDEWMSNSEPNAYVQTLSHVVYSRLKKRDSEEIGIFSVVMGRIWLTDGNECLLPGKGSQSKTHETFYLFSRTEGKRW